MRDRRYRRSSPSSVALLKLAVLWAIFLPPPGKAWIVCPTLLPGGIEGSRAGLAEVVAVLPADGWQGEQQVDY